MDLGTVVICEKPDQARTHAALFGVDSKGFGWIKAKNGWTFTYSIGHMIHLVEPDQMDERWKRWTLEALPIIPTEWKVAVDDGKAQQLKVVLGLLKSASEIIIATDCGREGELIGRELVTLAGNERASLRRLWISSLDEASLRKAWQDVRDGAEFEGLYRASLVRQRSDYIWGMSLSRAATLTMAPPKKVFPVGRVQTPTLALVVNRHEEIKNFVSRAYYEISASVTTDHGALEMRYAPRSEQDRLWDEDAALAMLGRVEGATGELVVKHATKREAPPKFPKLSDLQKTANRRWRWSLDKTLDICQKLYEAGYISYPRTSSNKLPTEQLPSIEPILRKLQEHGWTPGLAPTGASEPVIRKDRFVPEDEIRKESDHHAVIPMISVPATLGDDEQKMLYQLVADWFVASVSPDYVYNQCDVMLPANGVPLKTSGRTPIAMGFKALQGKEQEPDQSEEEDEGKAKLPPIQDGDSAQVQSAKLLSKATKPPSLYTDGTLLEDMISIHKFISDDNVKSRLKETSGLGTEATRANILKELKNRSLIVPAETGRGQIDCSVDAILLIRALPKNLKDPGLTAAWEDYMDQVKLDPTKFDEVMSAIESLVTKNCAKLTAAGLHEDRKLAGEGARVTEINGYKPTCPACSSEMLFGKSKHGHYWRCSKDACKATLQAEEGGKPKPQDQETPCLEVNGIKQACGACKSPMIFGKGKYGPYWRCSVSTCKSFIKADEKGNPVAAVPRVEGVDCPKCKKHKLVLRKGSRGEFWSCSGYPSCKHAEDVAAKA